jgi:hypothetical protein
VSSPYWEDKSLAIFAALVFVAGVVAWIFGVADPECWLVSLRLLLWFGYRASLHLLGCEETAKADTP